MMKRVLASRLEKSCVLALGLLLGCAVLAQGQTVLNFSLNEGSPNTSFTNADQTLVGYLGLTPVDPANAVGLSTDSPSGQLGDGSFTNANSKGYLLADSGADPVLNITNGPITMESWVKINPSFAGVT